MTSKKTGSRETAITFAEAAELLREEFGLRTHACTLRRWHRDGVNGVRLAGIRAGKHTFTYPAAVIGFVRQLNEGSASSSAA